MAMPKIEYDPARLLILDRLRAERRAVVSGLNDTLQTLRERRTDLQRRAQLARGNSEYSDPRGREGYAQEAERLAAEAAEVSRQMADAQARIDEVSAEAVAAGAVAKAALGHAIDKGLTIPSELRDRAHLAAGNVHPRGITITDGGAA